MKKENLTKRRNSTIQHQTTFRNSLKGKYNIKKTSNHHQRPINITNVKMFSSKEGQISQQMFNKQAPIT
jgi:hypothetical protein